MHPVVHELWDIELPHQLDAAGHRWPQLTVYAERVRNMPVSDTHAPDLLHNIRMEVDRRIDPELVHREGDEPVFELVAVWRTIELLSQPPGGTQ